MRYCLLLLACVAVVSCSARTDTSANGPAATVLFFRPPHVGTMLTLGEWGVDSNVQKIRDEGGISYTVDSVGISYSGKNNVMSYAYDARNQFAYISYEANGNISLFNRTMKLWQELPVATQDTRVWTASDTNAHGYIFKEERTTTYAGADTLTLAGRFFTAVKIREEVRDWHNDVLDSTQLGTRMYWYAPEFGWYIRYLGPPYNSLSFEYLAELESYTLN